MAVLALYLYCLVICVVAANGNVADIFDDFISQYERSYIKGSPEYHYRLSVFNESLSRHRRLNSLSTNPWDAKYGVTKFSDLTPEEFKDRYRNRRPKEQYANNTNNISHSSFASATDIIAYCNTSWDWRDYDIVSGVRDQKKCGSCWAFSVVETIESAFAKQTGTVAKPLSPQQLISCDKNADGCSGGDIARAMDWLVDTQTVVVPETIYPFNGGSGDTTQCRTDVPREGVLLKQFGHKGYVGMEKTVLEILCAYGPVSVAVDAISWQDYVGGIIQHHCPGVTLDHAVQIVGFNIGGPVPYYIVRNTWGADWGVDGYLYIKYDNDVCGIAREVVWVYDVENIPGITH